MRDASSEPGCSHDQKQPCPDEDGSGGSRDALSGRCEMFDGDGCRYDSHHAKVHEPTDQEDRHQIGAARTAVESEVHAMSPSRAGTSGQHKAAPWCLPEIGKLTSLPGGELEAA